MHEQVFKIKRDLAILQFLKKRMNLFFIKSTLFLSAKVFANVWAPSIS